MVSSEKSTYVNVPGLETGTTAGTTTTTTAATATTPQRGRGEEEAAYAVPRRATQSASSLPVPPPATSAVTIEEEEEDGDGGGGGGDVDHDKKDDESDGPEPDRESRYGRLVSEGRAQELRVFLSEHAREEAFLLGTLNTEKFGQTLHDQGIKDFPAVISPIDLALLSQKTDSLEILIHHCVDWYPCFSNYVRCRSFLNPGLVLEMLATCADPKPAEEMLNVRVDGNHDDEEVPEEDAELRLDLSVFHRPDRCPRKREAAALAAMLAAGGSGSSGNNNRDRLLRHPVSEAFLSVKWQRCRMAFYLSIFYVLALAAAASTASFLAPSSVALRWIPAAMAAPLAAATVIQVASGCGGFLYVSRLPAPPLLLPTSRCFSRSIPVLSFRGCVRGLLLLSVILQVVAANCTTPGADGNFFRHSSTLVVLLSWTEASLAVARVPCLSSHCRGLGSAAQEALRLSLLFLLPFVGLLFSLRAATSGEKPSSASPLPSAYRAFVELSRSLFVADDFFSALVPHLLLAILLMILFLVYLVAVFAAASAKVSETLSHRDDLEVARTVLELDDLEAVLNFPGCLARRFNLQHVFPDPFASCTVVKAADDGIFKVFPGRRRRRSLQESSHHHHWNRADIFDELTDAGGDCLSLYEPPSSSSSSEKADRPTALTLPARVCLNARPIVEELHDLVRCRMERGGGVFRQRDLGDYTSLYWNPEESVGRTAASENEYEIVGEGIGIGGGDGGGDGKVGGGRGGGFRYSSLSSCIGGGVRAFRESLLRELRRDLAKLLVGADKDGDGGGGDKRSVRVRPGLALGVITLQAGAGARGHKIVLQ